MYVFMLWHLVGQLSQTDPEVDAGNLEFSGMRNV